MKRNATIARKEFIPKQALSEVGIFEATFVSLTPVWDEEDELKGMILKTEEYINNYLNVKYDGSPEIETLEDLSFYEALFSQLKPTYCDFECINQECRGRVFRFKNALQTTTLRDTNNKVIRGEDGLPQKVVVVDEESGKPRFNWVFDSNII